jgi:hypothetical protein
MPLVFFASKLPSVGVNCSILLFPCAVSSNRLLYLYSKKGSAWFCFISICFRGVQSREHGPMKMSSFTDTCSGVSQCHIRMHT